VSHTLKRSTCQSHVSGFKGASFKKFKTLEEAEAFIAQKEKLDVYAKMIPTDMKEYWAERCHSPSKKKKRPLLENNDNDVLPDQKKQKLSENLDNNEHYLFAWIDSTLSPATGCAEIKQSVKEDYDFLIVYTDGACKGNGKTADAIAGVGAYFGPNDPRNISEPLPGPKQTNQRAELMVRPKFTLCDNTHSQREIIAQCARKSLFYEFTLSKIPFFFCFV
jgi:ribonuclease HI